MSTPVEHPHLFERPGVRPAGPGDIRRDIGPHYASNGLIGLIFSASGPVAVILAVGTAGGLSQAQLASWIFGIFLSAGLATIVMSLVYRQPFGYAWTIPGTVLLGPALQHLSWAEVVAAFFGTGLLIVALGSTGVVRRLMSAIPMPIVMAMVAAVFLKFGTDLVTSTQKNPVVAAPMVLTFIVLAALPALGRRLPPVLGALIVGAIAVASTGQFSLRDSTGPWFAAPVFTMPDFTFRSQLELVVPLMITILVVQNGQGVAVLRAAGHTPPVNVFAVTSGVFCLVNATVGAVGACVTGPTNAILTSSGQRQRQYTAAVTYGVLSLCCAAIAPTLTRLMLATPQAFILALGGIAMLRALQAAFVTAFSTKFTLGALVTFVVTISGLTILNISAAFWGIVIGYLVSRLLEKADYSDLNLPVPRPPAAKP